MFDERGQLGFHILEWFGLFAPKGTPKNVIAKLNAAVIDALADPTARARLATWGRRFFHASRRRRQRFARCRKPKLRSGGQSSGQRTPRGE
jgi:tripartite-type tricarboxylate transporter receptor subunit TctC